MSRSASAIVLHSLWLHGEAWRHPDVCDPLQRAWLERVRGSIDTGQRSSFVARWGRQVGKSWAHIALALSEMQRRPGIIIRYAALTGKSCLAIVKPTFEAMAATMPDAIRPVLSEQKGTITSPNGSVMVFAGTDAEQFDRLRGPKAHLIMLDESAFFSELERVEAALTPQLNTTHGLVLYFSSPPESPSHPFARRDAAHQAQGRWSKATIYDSPRYSNDDIAGIERAESERLGMTREELLASTYWEREYRANIVTEQTRAALPAWTDEVMAELVGDWERPKYFDAYSAHDPGITGDPHASLFAYHDPAANCLVIEDELELRSATHHVGMWADVIKAKEAELWGVSRWEGTLLGASLDDFNRWPEYVRRVVGSEAPRQPYLRVGDAAGGRCLDLSQQHGLAVIPSAKHDKALWVDTANQLIRERRIRVHRRCVRLLEQMRSTLWNHTRSQWEHTDKDHGDAVDCLTYLVRNVRWHRDARPPPPQGDWAFQPTQKRTGWAGVFSNRK